MSRETYITLATSDAYTIGALVLAASLKQTHTSKELTILISRNVSESLRRLLGQYFDNVIETEEIYGRDTRCFFSHDRPELDVTFTKIHCWGLVQFSKGVFLDADTVVLQNIDDLFEHEELSAVPDPCWPDCFNSGVFVFRPSSATFQALLKLSSESSSFDGGDQGLLNAYFAGWLKQGISHRLSYVYNCICRISDECGLDFYTSTPAWVQFGGSIRVAHFSGSIKPWHRVEAAKGCSEAAYMVLLGTPHDRRMITRTAGMLAYWWSIFLILVRPHLTSDMPGIAGTLSQLDLGNKLCARHERIETERMYAWERGDIDYTGGDRFANILAKLCDTMTKVGGESNLPIWLDTRS